MPSGAWPSGAHFPAASSCGSSSCTRRRTSSRASLQNSASACTTTDWGARPCPAGGRFEATPERVVPLLVPGLGRETHGELSPHVIGRVRREGLELRTDVAARCREPLLEGGRRREGEEAGVRQQKGSPRLRQIVGERLEVRGQVDPGPVVQDRRPFPSHPLPACDAPRVPRPGRAGPVPPSRRRPRPRGCPTDARRGRPACGWTPGALRSSQPLRGRCPERASGLHQYPVTSPAGARSGHRAVPEDGGAVRVRAGAPARSTVGLAVGRARRRFGCEWFAGTPW